MEGRFAQFPLRVDKPNDPSDVAGDRSTWYQMDLSLGILVCEEALLNIWIVAGSPNPWDEGKRLRSIK